MNLKLLQVQWVEILMLNIQFDECSRERNTVALLVLPAIVFIAILCCHLFPSMANTISPSIISLKCFNYCKNMYFFIYQSIVLFDNFFFKKNIKTSRIQTYI